MSFEVYYLDRRDGARVVKTEDMEFNDFWWRDGNASCDCNRSRFMYDGDDDAHKVLNCDGSRNIIVAEKIVLDGSVVYTDEGGVDPPADLQYDRFHANLDAAVRNFSDLYEARPDGHPEAAYYRKELQDAIENARFARDGLAAFPQGQQYLPILDACLRAAEAILAGQDHQQSMDVLQRFVEDDVPRLREVLDG